MINTNWKDFFDNHAPEYMNNVYVTNTLNEVDFIERELGLTPGMRILDLGCGTGRHSVELAKRGYKVTGVDLSEGMLAEAQKAAQAAGVGVEWIRADAVQFTASDLFDAAIVVCEGAFGLLGETEDPVTRDLTVLKNIAAALKPGGGFLITALSASKPLRQHTPEDIVNGIFDPMTMIEHNVVEVATPNGKMTFKSRERSFTVPELSLMCRIAGFDIEGAFGGTAGSWNKKTLELDEYEIMMICRKR